MKKSICLLTSFVLFVCGCSKSVPTKANENSTNVINTVSTEDESVVFTQNKDGDLVSPWGVSYTYLASEEGNYLTGDGGLNYLGELEFVGNVEGEEKNSQHLMDTFKTGMFAIKNDDSKNILIRRIPNSEWSYIYRKSSLPIFDFSVNNCVRLEFTSGYGNSEKGLLHTTCRGGITENQKIKAFIHEVTTQKNPTEAGFYDLVKKSNGMYENCYECGVVYGFFAEEPNLAIQMTVTSYNDLAYSISIGEKEFVLPETWLQKLIDSKCSH